MRFVRLFMSVRLHYYSWSKNVAQGNGQVRKGLFERSPADHCQEAVLSLPAWQAHRRSTQ